MSFSNNGDEIYAKVKKKNHHTTRLSYNFVIVGLTLSNILWLSL